MGADLQPIVWDVDGTLTQGLYDSQDLLGVKPDLARVALANSLQKQYPLVVSTARPEIFHKETKAWLNKYGLYPVEIYMKHDSDSQMQDHKVKENHLLLMMEKYGRPKLWFDDKKENCDMVKSYGIPCVWVRE